MKVKGIHAEVHVGDLPSSFDFGDSVAVDTETQGLDPVRDRLCLVQLSAGDEVAHLVQFPRPEYDAPNLKALLTDARVTKIFHYARFDVVMLKKYLGVDCRPLYCTKIASRLTRTYTDRHGLRDLCKDFLRIDLSKEHQSSDWAAATLTEGQVAYAALDVLYLHRLRAELDERLRREGRETLARACFDFVGTRAALDLMGWPNEDIFAH